MESGAWQAGAPVAGRECGGCQVCCMVLPVPELNKPPRRSCVHQCPQGCGIYAQRPASCSKFECLWKLSGALDESLRPDKCGVMFDVYEPEKTVIALSRAFSWQKGEAHTMIQRMLADKYVVWVRNVSSTHLILPEGTTEEEALKRFVQVKDRVYGST